MAEVISYHVADDLRNHVSTLTVRRNAPPTPWLFDARVFYPSLQASMSACDVTEPQTWYFEVRLSRGSDRKEVVRRCMRASTLTLNLTLTLALTLALTLTLTLTQSMKARVMKVSQCVKLMKTITATAVPPGTASSTTEFRVSIGLG